MAAAAAAAAAVVAAAVVAAARQLVPGGASAWRAEGVPLPPDVARRFKADEAAAAAAAAAAADDDEEDDTDDDATDSESESESERGGAADGLDGDADAGERNGAPEAAVPSPRPPTGVVAAAQEASFSPSK